MSDLPEPLSPPDCDLRGYDFMPLFGHRLFSSELYDRASAEEFRAALKLWWVAWQQCPAGSLPDDDIALCRQADLGKDTKAWKKLKAQALYGFVKCSDGRLYHPLLCIEAKEAFERRKKERERKAQMRAKRWGHDEDVPRDTTRTDHGQDMGLPARVRSDRTEQDRTGQNRKEEKKEFNNLSVTEVRAQPPERPSDAGEAQPPVDPPVNSVTIAAKLGRSLRHIAPLPGLKPARTVEEQLAELRGSVVPMTRAAPHEPVRTVEEQLAELGHAPQTPRPPAGREHGDEAATLQVGGVA